MGIGSREANGIISFSAGEFNDDGIVISKDGAPLAFGLFGVLEVESVGKSVVFGEFDEFGFAHGLRRYCDLGI